MGDQIPDAAYRLAAQKWLGDDVIVGDRVERVDGAAWVECRIRITDEDATE